MKITTKWITVTAMMMALVIVSGYIPVIPTPVGNVYWCDTFIMMGAFILDPIGSFVMGGIGTMIYDFIVGRTYMAIASLIIHGVQAVVISAIVHYVLPKQDHIVKAIVASVLGGIVVVGGYFLCRACIPFLYADAGLPLALAKMPANLIQEGVAIVLSILIVYVLRLKATLRKNNLLPAPIFSK